LVGFPGLDGLHTLREMLLATNPNWENAEHQFGNLEARHCDMEASDADYPERGMRKSRLRMGTKGDAAETLAANKTLSLLRALISITYER